MQRSVTVTRRRPLGWANAADLGAGEEAETAWHARGQGLIGLTMPGRPLRSLAAEDRSAAGIRDRTHR